MGDRPPTLARTASWVVDELRSRGVDVPASCRLGRYASQFDKSAYQRPWTPKEQALAVEQLMALRDVEEIAKFLEHFPDAPEEVLAPLVGDAIVPRLDASTPGRDRQLELFFAATCRAGDMDVELNREPDLWCRAGGAWLGLAVKRLRSEEKFEDRVGYAAVQVQKHAPWFGLVCVDVGLAWNPELRMVLTGRPPLDVARDNLERLSRRLDRHDGFLHRLWEKHPKSLGLLCTDHVYVHEAELGLVCYQYSVFHRSRRNDVHRARILREFQEGWMRGSENCVSLDGLPRTGMFSGPPCDRIMPMRPGTPDR